MYGHCGEGEEEEELGIEGQHHEGGGEVEDLGSDEHQEGKERQEAEVMEHERHGIGQEEHHHETSGGGEA